MSNLPDPFVSSAPLTLTAIQEKVLALLSAGSTVSAAAQATGLHRNTITYWRRTSASFRDALAEAVADKAQFWRDEAEQLAASAIEAIRAILSNPKAPAGVRLKAALAILNQVSTPPPQETSRPIPAEKPEIVHKNAQTTAPQTNPSPNPAPRIAKIGRNEPCPCASGRKFKHCCLNKPAASPVAPAA